MTGNVLVVSRYFPPGGGVGAFRSAKFVKYLSKLGWDSYVVSLPLERQQAFLPEDVNGNQYAEIADIPEERIYIDVPLPSISKSLGDTRRLPILAKRIPELVEEHNIDVIYHTAPPFYSLLSVGWVSRKINTPYVVDFRDPWYVNKDVFRSTKSFSNLPWIKFNELSERMVVKDADRVVLNTEKMEAMYSAEYPEQPNSFVTITNGYDPIDYDVEPVEVHDTSGFRIIHPGRFRGDMNGFLTAFNNCNSNQNLTLVHFGNKDRSQTKRFYRQAEKIGIRSAINHRAYADFEVVVSNIKSSDVGLIVTRRNDPTHVPTKTYDYIACDIPILALDSENSALDRILEPYENAYRIEHDDTRGITAALRQLANEKPTSLGDTEEIQKYTRENLTRQLAGVFDDLLV